MRTQTYYVPEDYIFTDTESCLAKEPDQAVTLMIGIYDYDKFIEENERLKKQLKIATDFLEEMCACWVPKHSAINKCSFCNRLKEIEDV